MSSANVSTARLLLRRLHARLVPGCVILLYHRVANVPADPYYLCIAPDNFAEHLQVIRDVARPIHLRDLARSLRMGRVPRRTVCVTFDDGYQDNLYLARPLLERHEIPATVFMTTGTVGRTREFWWDELQRIFLEPGTLPERLQLTAAGRTFDLQIGASAHFTDEDIVRYADWRIDAPDTPTPRHAAFRELYHVLQLLAFEEQRGLLDRLLDLTGAAPVVRPGQRALDADEVVRLGEGELIDIGGHTVNHPALNAQPVQVQRSEITGCKSTLEEWLGRRVTSFAYPYGLFSRDSIAEARRAGYDYACACLGHSVRRIGNRFLLPRIDPGDGSGETLARELDAAFRGQ